MQSVANGEIAFVASLDRICQADAHLQQLIQRLASTAIALPTCESQQLKAEQLQIRSQLMSLVAGAARLRDVLVIEKIKTPEQVADLVIRHNLDLTHLWPRLKTTQIAGKETRTVEKEQPFPSSKSVRVKRVEGSPTSLG